MDRLPIEIIVHDFGTSRRDTIGGHMSRWHAWARENPATWEAGATQDEAVSRLCITLGLVTVVFPFQEECAGS